MKLWNKIKSIFKKKEETETYTISPEQYQAWATIMGPGASKEDIEIAIRFNNFDITF